MGKREEIGKIFSSKFKKFERSPSEGVWDAIATQLDQEKSNKIAPLWYYITGAALLVGIVSGVFFFQNEPLDRNTIVSTEQQPSNLENKKQLGETTYNENKQNTKAVEMDKYAFAKADSQDSQTKASIANKVAQQSPYENLTTIKNTPSYKESQQLNGQNNVGTTLEQIKEQLALLGHNTILKNDSQLLEYQKRNALELQKAIATQLAESEQDYANWLKEIENKKTALKKQQESVVAAQAAANKQKTNKPPKLPKTEEEKRLDREAATTYKFAVSPYTSAIRYATLSRGSSIDNRLANNPRESIGTTGYGIRAEYALNEKSSLRFGIGIAPLQYRTDNFQVSTTQEGVLNIFQLSGISVSNLSQGGIQTSPQALAFFANSDVVSIEQNISYIEFPLDFQYKLVNPTSRFGLSLNSGLSALVLTSNDVFATSELGNRLFIGQESDLNGLSLAFNLGLGASYNFTKHWRFNTEPLLRYQINPYANDNNNFRPFYVGLELGLSYKFQ